MAENWEHGDIKVPAKDSWEDEEDDNVKDAWDEEEEEPAPKPVTKKAAPVSAKSNVPFREMTEEEKKDAQINADFANATELFGLEKSLDDFSLDSVDDYKDFVNRINARLITQTKKSFYFDFVEELFKSMSQSFNSDQVKKLSNSLKIISEYKLAEERLNKPKDVKKTKSKAKIKLEQNRIKGDFDEFLKDSNRVFDEDEDENDFM